MRGGVTTAIFSRKTVLLLLLSFLILSIAIRYPLVEHERQQTDSYFIHMLSDSIATNGYACWIFHPLSLFGYYPFSYPSGTPFLIAELSELTGLGIEAAILVFDMAIVCLFCLAVFGLTRLFIARPEYVMLATLLAILGSRFVDTTYWDGSARGLFVVMCTLLIFTLFLSASTRRPLLFLPAFAFGSGCFFVHHMAVLLLVFALAYLVAAFQIQFLIPKLRHEKRGILRHEKRGIVVAYNIGLVLLVFALSYATSSIFQNPATLTLSDTSLFNFEPEVLAILLNIAASYTNQVGFILPIAVIGIHSVLTKHRLSMASLFPIAVLVAIVPILANSLYISMVIAPFVAILGVIWLSKLREDGRRRRRFKIAIIVMLIVSSLILPVWSMQRWNQRTDLSGGSVEVDCQRFNDAAYLTHVWDGLPAMSNVNALTLQLSAVSAANFIGPGMFLPLSGDITAEEVVGNTTLSSARFPVNLYDWLDYEDEPMVSSYVRGLMTRGLEYVYGLGQPQAATQYLLSHETVWIVIDNSQSTKYIDAHSVLDAKFITQLRSATWILEGQEDESITSLDSYLTHASEGISLFMFRYPT